jgi:hypothetical protein
LGHDLERGPDGLESEIRGIPEQLGVDPMSAADFLRLAGYGIEAAWIFGPVFLLGFVTWRIAR